MKIAHFIEYERIFVDLIHFQQKIITDRNSNIKWCFQWKIYDSRENEIKISSCSQIRKRKVGFLVFINCQKFHQALNFVWEHFHFPQSSPLIKPILETKQHKISLMEWKTFTESKIFQRYKTSLCLHMCVNQQRTRWRWCEKCKMGICSINNLPDIIPLDLSFELPAFTISSTTTVLLTLKNNLKLQLQTFPVPCGITSNSRHRYES